MTTPTQAQIEALQAIKKLRDETPGTNRNDYDAGYNRALEVCGDIAEAALTAAAEVKPKTEDAFTHAMDIAEAKAATLERCAQWHDEQDQTKTQIIKW